MKRLIAILLAVALVGVGAILVIAVDAKDAPRFTARVANGRLPQAPDLVLDRLGQPGQARLSAYRGRVVVVNFYASWCVTCKDESAVLARFARQYRGSRSVALVGIDNEDLAADGLAFARAQGYAYDLFHAKGQAARTPWGVTAYPETFVLDAQGRAVSWFPGPVDDAALAQAIAKAAAA